MRKRPGLEGSRGGRMAGPGRMKNEPEGSRREPEGARGKPEGAGGRKMQCGKQDLNLHGITTTRPSTWRVCQFRHSRSGTNF